MEGKPDVSSNDTGSDVVFGHGKMLGVSNLGTELVEEKMLFVCAQCKVLFDSQESCARHMREYHNLLDFNFSDIQLTDTDEPRRTRVKIKRSRLTSPECGSLTPKKVYIPIENHLYRCAQCPYTFETLEVFQFHEASHADRDTTRGNRFICRICQGQHESDKRLGINRNSIAQAGSSESEPANNSDSGLPQLYYESWGKCSWHLWKQHKIDCELPSCLHSLCDFKSLFLQKVREHEAVHSPVRHFRCDICHKTFKQLKQLRTHEKYHRTKNTNLPPPTESRWYTTQKCDICSRVLSDSKCLKKHIAVVHNKLKPHTCNVCGHQSARKAELQLHLRTHTREKPHKCPTCPYATGDHNSLRRHVLTHSSKQKPYSCPLCPFTCIQSAGFKKHVIARHAADEAMNSLFVCPYCPHISVSKSVHEYHIQDHDQGRIPIQDMQQTAEARNSSAGATSSRAGRPFLAHEDSSSNSVDFGTRNSSYWNREDDSSVDMVDTGGITIPATQPQPTTSPSPILLE